MSTLAPLPPDPGVSYDADDAPLAREAPGLTVVLAAPEVLAVGAPLVRRGSALALVAGPEPMMRDAERALALVGRAGFDVRAVETVAPEGLRARLRSLGGERVACAIVPGDTARRVRSLATWLRAPVLAVPPRSAPAAGPAVLDARDAPRTIPALAACLATARAVAVAPVDVTPTGSLTRSAAHPLLVPRLELLAELHRWDALAESERCAEVAATLAHEHGLEAETLEATGADGVLAAARFHDGLVVVADDDGWRPPPLLRAALRERRPTLLVPAT